MAYKLLGFVVWKGTRWYVNRRARAVGHLLPSRRVGGALVVALAIGGLVAAGARRDAAATAG
jgi:hypothetical protein